MPASLDSPRERLILPVMGPVYDYFAKPGIWLVLRLVVGILLMMSGWPKITSPLGMSGMLQGMGFWPGWFWSPLVALTEFGAGALIAIGLFTRPAAVAATLLLLVTLWFHWSNPYGPAVLTPEGIAYFAGEGAQYLTEFGRQQIAADGGAGFLSQVTGKAVYASLFWTLATALFAAFGGGYFSVDRMVLNREF